MKQRDSKRLMLMGLTCLLGIGTTVIGLISGMVDDKKMELMIEEKIDERLGNNTEETGESEG